MSTLLTYTRLPDSPPDDSYCGIPFVKGGRTREGGLACGGLAALFLKQEFGIDLLVPPDKAFNPADVKPLDTMLLGYEFRDESELERGDLVFLRAMGAKVTTHVVVWLGNGQLLNTGYPVDSRIENGFTLLRRAGLLPWARVQPGDILKFKPLVDVALHYKLA